MHGERILCRSLSVAVTSDSFGNLWQYHSRSDRLSKISCWGVLFDTLLACPLLRQHANRGLIRFGINHAMTDFVTGREKVLDLVVCIPRGDSVEKSVSFRSLANRYGIALDAAGEEAMRELPDLDEGPVGDVLMALESKACMTAHHKAAPRLFDELTSAGQCINGAAPGAIAACHVIINSSTSFHSSDRNKRIGEVDTQVVSADSQPASLQKALSTVRRLVVRGHATERGYDAVGITVLDMKNNGTPVKLAAGTSALAPNDGLHYERMSARIAGLYDTRFQNR